MAGEQPVLELALALVSKTPETKVEGSVVEIEAPASQVEGVVVDSTEGSDDDTKNIDIEEENIINHPTKPSHVDFKIHE
jgi:hypothetical protein